MDSQTNEVNVNGESFEAEKLDHTEEDEEEEEEEEEEAAYKSQPLTGDGASPGKIFIGGLARETTSAQFVKHFGKYGEIIDSVIMKDRKTGQPRGFGFVTYADPSVVDKVIQDNHIINGKQVEIKRTIPRGASGSKDFKTKKIFVGGIPSSVNEDEFKDFFSQYGVVKEHQIMRDHATNRSRGFGFITFETEQSVDDLLSKGNKIDLSGSQVEIKKAEPKKPNSTPAPPSRYSNPSSRSAFGYADTFDDYSAGYRLNGPYSGRHSSYGGLRAYDDYPGNEFGGYGGYGAGAGASGYGPYRGEPSVGYSGRYGGGGAFGNRPYDLGGFGGSGHGYGGYGGGGSAGGGGGYGSGYDAGLGGGYGGGGGGGAGSFYGGRGGYGGAGAANSRYHPYGR